MKRGLKLLFIFTIVLQFAIMANSALAICVCTLPTVSANYANCYTACATTAESLCATIADCALSGPPATGGTNIPSTGGTNTPPSGGSTANLTNPISANSVPELVGNIINVALGIVGSLALIMFIYGGFTWMLAAGNDQAVEKGRNILVWATIGLVVIFASYSLVNFIINTAIVGK
jgi:hypothetical protein